MHTLVVGLLSDTTTVWVQMQPFNCNEVERTNRSRRELSSQWGCRLDWVEVEVELLASLDLFQGMELVTGSFTCFEPNASFRGPQIIAFPTSCL